MGIIKWNNGDSWKGYYLLYEKSKSGELASEGVMTFAETGNTLTGRWSPDLTMKNGQGIMTLWVKSKNRIEKGEWINGVFINRN